jgi:hypothetical protein
MGRTLYALVVFFAVAIGCSSGPNEANRRGVGADCSATVHCSETGQVCLTEFNGGYCGISGCHHDTDCPQGSACVTDDNQTNYCFLVCAAKTDCNLNRTAADESDCTSSLTFVDGTMNRKVCRPPLSGTGPVDASAD